MTWKTVRLLVNTLTANDCRNIDSVSTTAPLPYSLTTAKVIQLEKVTVSDMQNLKTVS